MVFTQQKKINFHLKIRFGNFIKKKFKAKNIADKGISERIADDFQDQ